MFLIFPEAATCSTALPFSNKCFAEGREQTVSFKLAALACVAGWSNRYDDPRRLPMGLHKTLMADNYPSAKPWTVVVEGKAANRMASIACPTLPSTALEFGRNI